MTSVEQVELAKSYGFACLNGNETIDNDCSICFVCSTNGQLVFVWQYDYEEWNVSCLKHGDFRHYEYHVSLVDAILAGQTIWERNSKVGYRNS